jgi:hypothetical protein
MQSERIPNYDWSAEIPLVSLDALSRLRPIRAGHVSGSGFGRGDEAVLQ